MDQFFLLHYDGDKLNIAGLDRRVIGKKPSASATRNGLARQRLEQDNRLDWQRRRLELEPAERRLREEEALNREIQAKATEARSRKIDTVLDRSA